MAVTLAAACMTAFLLSSVLAQESPDAGQPAQPSVVQHEAEEPLWEAGVIGTGVSHPAYPGAEERTSLLLGLPYVLYRGKYLRVDQNTVGVRAIKTPRTEFDVGFGASLGSHASDIKARQGMDDLGILLEFGPRLKINLGDKSESRRESRMQFTLRGVFDANDHLRYHGIAFEPQWVNEIKLADGWRTSTSIGALFGDQLLVDTFYRVSPAEATATRQAYDARSGLISLRASLFASHTIAHDVNFFCYLRYDSLQGAANHDSPLVRRDGGWSGFLGIAWTMAHSERSARD